MPSPDGDLAEMPFSDSADLPAQIPNLENPIPYTLVNSRPLDNTQFIAPYVPCSLQVVQAVLRFANIQSSDVLVDLGCGDGRILFAAHESDRPPAFSVGIELDPYLVKHAKEKALQLERQERIAFIEQDMFTVNLDQLELDSGQCTATVLILYLLPTGLDKLKPQLHRWLNGGPLPTSGDADCHLSSTPPKLTRSWSESSWLLFSKLCRSVSLALRSNEVRESSCSPNRRIITITYSIPGWEPSEAVEAKAAATNTAGGTHGWNVNHWLFRYDKTSVASTQ
ncbi:uncharacterized protein BJ171DRAFT_520766 [Polychytrium aggregatum]|uniref:uncharacterized protein n=1 Tax=Polychytrium aggregatum TaxID=110093 RepID=UPI0022FE5DBA|nr:uncharacterized protein BJ171DRAFT_547073 [Polychytrium aggregatum]XP_052962965.1 uncharacterized protein BJ171DRAFT_520766 [Polychytrium aggregatum]KAI9188629.1 hypothetical protein BJ171DRAFT_547073 [Polychytrium aggregatum]KAI9197308.1 hypothetical protein BJ171DRAFT_520766 [Polychytrium aggregatum]